MKTEEIAEEFLERANEYIEESYDSIDLPDISTEDIHQLCTDYLELSKHVERQQMVIDALRKALGHKQQVTISEGNR